MNLQITTKLCRMCNATALGTQMNSTRPGEPADFVCRHCDPKTFDDVSEQQKSAFLAGAISTTRGVQ